MTEPVQLPRTGPIDPASAFAPAGSEPAARTAIIVGPGPTDEAGRGAQIAVVEAALQAGLEVTGVDAALIARIEAVHAALAAAGASTGDRDLTEGPSR